MDGWNGERQIGKNLKEIEPKHIERYNIAFDYAKNGKILDASCGCGYGSLILSKKEDSTVIGIDNSKEAIEYAKEWYAKDNITFKIFDMNSDIYSLGKFDTIVSLETIEHIKTSIPNTLKKFHNSLNKGGILIISHPDLELPPGGKFHVHTNISGKVFVRLMKKIGFEIIYDYYQVGRWTFLYHVVVGRKI